MKKILLLGFVGLACTSTQAQFEIRHHSEVFASYVDWSSGQGEGVLIEDILDTTTTVGSALFSQSHSASYEQPGLSYDPNSTSSFSVDSFEVIQQHLLGYFVEYGISGSLSRQGPGSFAQDDIVFFETESHQSILIDLVPITPNGQSAFFQYTIDVEYVSDQIGPGTQLFSMVGIRSDGTEDFLEGLNIGSGQNSAQLSVSWTSAGSYTSIRLDFHGQHLNWATNRPGENYLNYNMSFLTLVPEIPAPGTTALPAMAGLLLARRRRGR